MRRHWDFHSCRSWTGRACGRPQRPRRDGCFPVQATQCWKPDIAQSALRPQPEAWFHFRETLPWGPQLIGASVSLQSSPPIVGILTLPSSCCAHSPRPGSIVGKRCLGNRSRLAHPERVFYFSAVRPRGGESMARDSRDSQDARLRTPLRGSRKQKARLPRIHGSGANLIPYRGDGELPRVGLASLRLSSPGGCVWPRWRLR